MPSLRYLGHSAFQIRHEQFDILIDPFITHNPLAAVTAEELEPTHILVTHGHGDHLGDTEAIAKRTGCQVIAVHEIAEWLSSRGVNAWGMGIGGARSFDFGRVYCTIAHHTSSLDAAGGAYAGNPMGYVITIGGTTYYHAGDTGVFLDMELIGRRNAIDVAMLPIGDNYTMGPEDAALAVEMLKPKLAVPMHYNTFGPIEVDPERFRSLCAEKGFEARVLKPGETL